MTLLLLTSCLAGCVSLPGGEQVSSQVKTQQGPQAHLTYVAIGASDTFGTGTDDPPTQSWPVDLADRLGNDVHLVNLGVPGIHAHDALNIELPVALDTHPDLITVWLAVNDLADNVPLDSYSQDLDSVLGRLQSSFPHTRIVIANVPDLTLLPHFRSIDANLLHARINTYNNVISNLVQRHHILLVDLYQQWSELANHPEYISSDGFHPNALGYAQLAEIFYQVLQKANA